MVGTNRSWNTLLRTRGTTTSAQAGEKCDEFLDGQVFYSLKEACVLAKQSRMDSRIQLGRLKKP